MRASRNNPKTIFSLMMISKDLDGFLALLPAVCYDGAVGGVRAANNTSFIRDSA